MGDKSNYKHYENISIMLQMDTLTFEAESVAFIVCNALGLDTSSYSFPYLNSWARTTEELKKVIDTIQKIAFNTITLLRDGGLMEECV